MTVRLIRTTPIDIASMLTVDGRPIQQRHPALMRVLAAQGLGDQFILAEPIVTFPTETRPGQIAWYLDSAREPVPIDLLAPDPARQARLHLERLLPRLLLAASSDPGRLLYRALVLASTDGILWTDGSIVAVDWGLVPGGAVEPLPALELTPLFSAMARQDSASIPAPSPSAKERPVDPVEMPPVRSHHLQAAGAPHTASVRSGSRTPWPLLLHLVTGLVFLLLGLATGLRLLDVPISDMRHPWRHANIGSGE